MAGIHNINSLYNINTKKHYGKLTFEVGQKILARILSVNENNSEVLLKLLDGWQFPAELEAPLEFLPDGLVKFEIEGFKDGKLKIKLANNNVDVQENDINIEDILKSENINVSKEDYAILDKMIKHDIPLTKENIVKIKTSIDLKNKVETQEGQDNFISKYLNSKGIEQNSVEGQNISKILKGFFNELAKLKVDDILFLHENNIELTENNIKSYVRVFKEDSVVYNEIKELSNNINDMDKTISNDMLDKDNILNKDNNYNTSEKHENKNVIDKEIENNNVNVKSNNKLENIQTDTLSKNEINDVSKQDEAQLVNKDILSKEAELSQNKEINKNDVNTKKENEDSINSKNEKTSVEKEVTLKKDFMKAMMEGKDVKLKHSQDIVKDQMSLKTQELKEIIKNLLGDTTKGQTQNYNEIAKLLQKHMNDFKVFNSVSNQYYYMDLPVDADKYEYQCKLIVKDDRKKGKKIDSKHVKIATSVKTINMGVVDAFIKVNNNIMDIDIKCTENWMNLIETNKFKLVEMLQNSNYNVYVKVDKKKEEFNLSNCREFFQDSELSKINIRV